MIYKNLLSNTILLIYTISSNVIIASGAYDKGTATGKGLWEFNLTINPFNLISYGQNYAVISYGLSDKTDFVFYYSQHQNKSESLYFGGLYQFANYPLLDLATAFGARKILKETNSYDLFFPQLLYNVKLPKSFSIGGSLVNVVDVNKKYLNKGYALDITFFSPIPFIEKISPKIIDAYFGIGLFKNTGMELFHGKKYFHYSFDITLYFGVD